MFVILIKYNFVLVGLNFGTYKVSGSITANYMFGLGLCSTTSGLTPGTPHLSLFFVSLRITVIMQITAGLIQECSSADLEETTGPDVSKHART
jgi:hypothetical protein